ncbi:MAG: FAD-dependent oxidoreductase [Solirubrobacteraceae bacterium]
MPVCRGRSSRHATAVVIAVPPTVIAAIVFDPQLTAAKVAALGGVRFGQAAKLFIALRSPA